MAHTLRKIIGAMAGVGLAAAIVVAAPAQDASAADPLYCPSGFACSWADPKYETHGDKRDMHGFSDRETDMQDNFFTYNHMTVNDNISSIHNNGRVSSARFFKDPNGGGFGYLLIERGGVNGALGVNSPSYNDSISSACFPYYCW